MIAIIDYGVGNLFSLESSLKSLGLHSAVTRDADVIAKADRIILPGVGAFADAMEKLEATGLVPVIREEVQSKPLLGICLGMQLLFDKSYEYGEHPGLGLIPGEVIPMAGLLPPELKIPHIGWNALRIRKDSPLLRNVTQGDFVYFVHSYFAAQCDSSVIADTAYGQWLTAAVQHKNVFGCQFHPEKSGTVGLNILKAFAQLEDSLC